MQDFEPFFPEDGPPIEEDIVSATATKTDSGSDVTEEFQDDVYKKWFKTGSKSGFISINTWFEAGKVSVDIGETGAGSLKGNTKVFTNAIEIATYLRAVYDGNAATLYPERRDGPTAESFVYYGGGQIEGKPVSRILKIHHWATGKGENKSFDTSAFVWKCGHFQARKTDSGAFIPDMSKPALSVNLIKVTRKEMAEIHYRMDLALHAFAAREQDLFRSLNGNRR